MSLWSGMVERDLEQVHDTVGYPWHMFQFSCVTDGFDSGFMAKLDFEPHAPENSHLGHA